MLTMICARSSIFLSISLSYAMRNIPALIRANTLSYLKINGKSLKHDGLTDRFYNREIKTGWNITFIVTKKGEPIFHT